MVGFYFTNKIKRIATIIMSEIYIQWNREKQEKVGQGQGQGHPPPPPPPDNQPDWTLVKYAPFNCRTFPPNRHMMPYKGFNPSNEC